VCSQLFIADLLVTANYFAYGFVERKQANSVKSDETKCASYAVFIGLLPEGQPIYIVKGTVYV
jgi:hypothetical protein